MGDVVGTGAPDMQSLVNLNQEIPANVAAKFADTVTHTTSRGSRLGNEVAAKVKELDAAGLWGAAIKELQRIPVGNPDYGWSRNMAAIMLNHKARRDPGIANGQDPELANRLFRKGVELANEASAAGYDWQAHYNKATLLQGMGAPRPTVLASLTQALERSMAAGQGAVVEKLIKDDGDLAALRGQFTNVEALMSLLISRPQYEAPHLPPVQPKAVQPFSPFDPRSLPR